MPDAASSSHERLVRDSLLPLSPPSDLPLPGPRAGPKACVPCARLKVKCEIEPEGICKRCRRLGKVCGVQQPGAQSRKTKPKASAVARLEQKLDGVAAILAASERERERERAAGRTYSESPGLSPYPSLWSPTDYWQQYIKDDAEAQLILDAFRNDMAPYFPFVVIPTSSSLDELKQQKPFLLFSAMMAGCRHDRTRQAGLAKAFRELLSQRVALMGEQSLDLLQGLLVYIAWYHVHLHLGPQLTYLVHMAMAMLTELHLNRPTQPSFPSKPVGAYCRGYFIKNRPPPPARTLEERRAFLGCFYTTFIVSMCSRDIEQLRYTKYADDCVRVISEAAEYPSDMYLVRLTQLCCLGDRISRTLGTDDWDSSSSSSGISAPIGACVRSFEAELHQLKHNLPLSDQNESDTTTNPNPSTPIPYDKFTGSLIIYQHAVEVFLYETALNDNIPLARYGTFPMARLNMLFACLHSTKSCLDAFFSLPGSVYLDMPYLLWSPVGHAIVIASKLNLLVSDGWDQEYVRSILDFPAMVDTLATKFGAAGTAAGEGLAQKQSGSLPQALPEIFANMGPKLQRLKEVHEFRGSNHHARPEYCRGQSRAEQQASSQTASDDELNGPGFTALFEFLDEDFWQQFT